MRDIRYRVLQEFTSLSGTTIYELILKFALSNFKGAYTSNSGRHICIPRDDSRDYTIEYITNRIIDSIKDTLTHLEFPADVEDVYNVLLSHANSPNDVYPDFREMLKDAMTYWSSTMFLAVSETDTHFYVDASKLIKKRF